MTDINIVALVGRLTRDADLKYSNSGLQIMSFSIAVNSAKKGSDGKYEDEASFFDCTLFGKYAEAVHKYMVKGKQVGVKGRLHQDRWKDKQSGDPRSKVAIIAESVELLGSSKESSGGASSGGNGGQSQSSGEYDQGDFPDDIPF